MNCHRACDVSTPQGAGKRGLAEMRARDGNASGARRAERRLIDTSTYCIPVHRYGDSAVVNLESSPAAASLFQVWMTRDAHGSRAMDFREAFNEYLEQTAGSGDILPDTRVCREIRRPGPRWRARRH